jgi:hypothetical protein
MPTGSRVEARRSAESVFARLISEMRRRSRLTPDRMENILQVMRAGGFFNQACALAGISEATGYSWKERGEDDLENDVDSFTGPLWRSFGALKHRPRRPL